MEGHLQTFYLISNHLSYIMYLFVRVFSLRAQLERGPPCADDASGMLPGLLLAPLLAARFAPRCESWCSEWTVSARPRSTCWIPMHMLFDKFVSLCVRSACWIPMHMLFDKFVSLCVRSARSRDESPAVRVPIALHRGRRHLQQHRASRRRIRLRRPSLQGLGNRHRLPTCPVTARRSHTASAGPGHRPPFAAVTHGLRASRDVGGRSICAVRTPPTPAQATPAGCVRRTSSHRHHRLHHHHAHRPRTRHQCGLVGSHAPRVLLRLGAVSRRAVVPTPISCASIRLRAAAAPERMDRSVRPRPPRPRRPRLPSAIACTRSVARCRSFTTGGADAPLRRNGRARMPGSPLPRRRRYRHSCLRHLALRPRGPMPPLATWVASPIASITLRTVSFARLLLDWRAASRWTRLASARATSLGTRSLATSNYRTMARHRAMLSAARWPTTGDAHRLRVGFARSCRRRYRHPRRCPSCLRCPGHHQCRPCRHHLPHYPGPLPHLPRRPPAPRRAIGSVASPLAARPHPPRRPHRLALCRRNRSCSARGSATPGVLEAVLEAVLEVVRPWVRRSESSSSTSC